MELIYKYIAYNLLSPDNALKQYDRIANSIETLKTFSERCRQLEIESESKTEMRKLLADNSNLPYLNGVTGDEKSIFWSNGKTQLAHRATGVDKFS